MDVNIEGCYIVDNRVQENLPRCFFSLFPHYCCRVHYVVKIDVRSGQVEDWLLFFGFWFGFFRGFFREFFFRAVDICQESVHYISVKFHLFTNCLDFPLHFFQIFHHYFWLHNFERRLCLVLISFHHPLFHFWDLFLYIFCTVLEISLNFPSQSFYFFAYFSSNFTLITLLFLLKRFQFLNEIIFDFLQIFFHLTLKLLKKLSYFLILCFDFFLNFELPPSISLHEDLQPKIISFL